MVRNDYHALTAQAEPLAFHRGGNHLKCLPGSDNVGEQRVRAVKYPRYRVPLVLRQPYLWVHAGKCDMRAVVFSRPRRVEDAVVFFDKHLAPRHVAENPVLELIFYSLLFLLRDSRLLLVYLARLLAVGQCLRIVDCSRPSVERVLYKPVGVCARSAVCLRRHYVACVSVFTVYTPFCRIFGIGDLKLPLHKIRAWFKQFHDEIPHVLGVHPCAAETHVDVGGGEFFRLDLFKRGNVVGIFAWTSLFRHAREGKFLHHVSREIFVAVLEN